MNDDYLQKAYRETGIVHPLPALSNLEVRDALANYYAMCNPGQVVLQKDHRLFAHLLYPWAAQLIAHPAILRAVRALIGPDVLVWVSEFNVKAPRTEGFFSWHQDLYYWKRRYTELSAIPIVTVWLALTAANEANGAMQILPNSHSALLDHTEKPNPNNMLTRAQEVCNVVDQSRTTCVELAAGEFSIHHPLLLHASGPNRSASPRIGLVARYVAPSVVPAVRPAYTWLVSGEDSSGNWDHVAPLDQLTGPALRQKCISAVQAATGARFK